MRAAYRGVPSGVKKWTRGRVACDRHLVVLGSHGPGERSAVPRDRRRRRPPGGARRHDAAPGAGAARVRGGRPVKLVLASASPRRRELLDAIGLGFAVRPIDLDEAAAAGTLPAVDAASAVATAKARAIAGK